MHPYLDIFKNCLAHTNKRTQHSYVPSYAIERCNLTLKRVISKEHQILQQENNFKRASEFATKERFQNSIRICNKRTTSKEHQNLQQKNNFKRTSEFATKEQFQNGIIICNIIPHTPNQDMQVSSPNKAYLTCRVHPIAL